MVLAVLLAVQTWSSHSRFNTLREEMARSLQKGNASNAETAQLARDAEATAKELQVKVGVLESRQSNRRASSWRWNSCTRTCRRTATSGRCPKIEQVLSTASQQLQLAGNVQGALIALQNADRSLSRSDKPQFITIRRAIARDIDKLKALPSVDLAGIALRLDSAIGQIDALPLLSDEKPAEPSAPGRVNVPARLPQAGQPAPTPEGRWAWASASRDLAQLEPRDVGRHAPADPRAHRRHAGSADAVAERIYFVRENLKLRLLNARLALLSRNEGTFRDDLRGPADAVTSISTPRRAHPAVQALLRQVQANNVRSTMPTLADSLNAVRNYKSKP
jgi:uroporphyrin-3 C-methyltransferase